LRIAHQLLLYQKVRIRAFNIDINASLFIVAHWLVYSHKTFFQFLCLDWLYRFTVDGEYQFIQGGLSGMSFSFID
jgi:hypothetical protein